MKRNLAVPCSAVVLLTAWMLAGPVLAQEGSAATQGAAAARPRVTNARSNDRKHPNQAALGDAISLSIPALKSYLNGDATRCEDLVLFLDEVAIHGSSPESCDPFRGEVRFLLDRTDESDAAWRALLAEPVGFSRKVSVSCGPSGRLLFETEVNDFELVVVPPVELYGFLAAAALGLAGLFRLARRTTLLRASGPGTASGIQAPYSLARFQLAFWSFLVIAAYVFIWLITEELDTITGSVLVLLGIGSGTALGAAFIDQSKPQAPAGPNPVSQGFLRDVLSDDQGISLHRFQLFIWTLILGIIFCASVYNGLAMPQFSPTLLGLMGLSSGTYLGFKVPEPPRRE
ncbi:MAG: hypothetical protein ABUT39_06320 [Acidobacteriota bacterium]